MKALALIMALTAALLYGCSKKPDRTDGQVLKAPATREEALAMMRTADAEAAFQGWNENVEREFRRRMTSRLLAAGMTPKEIDQWIVSPLTQ